jgi:hypothetical protein
MVFSEGVCWQHERSMSRPTQDLIRLAEVRAARTIDSFADKAVSD